MGDFRVLAGYKAHNGHIFTEKQARIYNRACDTADLIKKIRGEGSEQHERAIEVRFMTFKTLIGEF